MFRRWSMTEDGRVSCSVDDIASELPTLISELGQTAERVVDLHVEAPSLQDVFIHLTGRELRE